MGNLIHIRGTRIYIEELGQSNEEALLYLHGGPGASCIDFTYHQAQVLSSCIRVIAIDQRGVLRSDPIQEDDPFGIQDIIEDCEEIRKALGIERWSVLGHSFGGYIALLYAHQYPKSVKKVIYEAPMFDSTLSMKSLFRFALPLFEQENQADYFQECQKYIHGTYSSSELWNAWLQIGNQLGDKRDYVYFHGIDPLEYNKIFDNPEVTEELLNRSYIHGRRLQEEGAFFESLLPLLPSIQQPSLLLSGKYDPVCCEEQTRAFKDLTPNRRIIVFEDSGHFPRIEEREKYTSELLKFISE